MTLKSRYKLSKYQDIMIGDEAAPCRGLLELSHPLEEGIIKNWDDMELIWEYGYKKVLE